MDAIDRNSFPAQTSDYSETAVLGGHEHDDGNRLIFDVHLCSRRPVHPKAELFARSYCYTQNGFRHKGRRNPKPLSHAVR